MVTTVNGDATLFRAVAAAQPVSLHMRDEIFVNDRIHTHLAEGPPSTTPWEPSTAPSAQGNGLGLAVVWGIVARHGGQIEVETALGRGTTFVVGLPVPVPTVLPEDTDPGDASRLPDGTRVLLVEDNLEILRSLADLPRDSGCRVIEAPDGMAALSRIHSEHVDLVLTDLAMPGISGWEVATACRERFPAAPIGLITGVGDQLYPERIERHGIRFVVAKPFTSGELVREIAAALRAENRA